MGTRSRIGVQLPNGKVKSVYCHWDGYPDGVGRDLKRKGFRNVNEVVEFIEEGDRSTVDESYHEMRGEEIRTQLNDSVEEYCKSDLEEFGYLFTPDNEWKLVGSKNVLKSF